MIKANELRLGNWIKGAYEFQIEEIRKDGIYDIYDPVPLTPEILEACGFDMLSLSKDFVSLIYDDKDYWYSEYLPNSHPLKYLHQLQNLYFVLTGQELTINLNVESTI